MSSIENTARVEARPMSSLESKTARERRLAIAAFLGAAIVVGGATFHGPLLSLYHLVF